MCRFYVRVNIIHLTCNQVKLSGVLDLQLPEVMYRRENTATGSSQFFTKHKRRSQRTDEVESMVFVAALSCTSRMKILSK